MDGYTILAGALIFFVLFIYLTWFGTSIKMEKQKEEKVSIKINPYDNLPLSRKLIDNVRDLVKGARSYLPYTAGKYKLLVETTVSASITLTEIFVFLDR